MQLYHWFQIVLQIVPILTENAEHANKKVMNPDLIWFLYFPHKNKEQISTHCLWYSTPYMYVLQILDRQLRTVTYRKKLITAYEKACL